MSATIEIVAEPRGLSSLLWMKVSISIDGAIARFRLGTHAFSVAPGSHDVAVGLGTAFGSKARATVLLESGETARLYYRLRLGLWIFGGTLEREVPSARARR
jgi:hypothetical protein